MIQIGDDVLFDKKIYHVQDRNLLSQMLKIGISDGYGIG